MVLSIKSIDYLQIYHIQSDEHENIKHFLRNKNFQETKQETCMVRQVNSRLNFISKIVISHNLRSIYHRHLPYIFYHGHSFYKTEIIHNI